MRPANHLTGFAHGLLSYRTSIDDHQISRIRLGGDIVTRRLEIDGPLFQFGFIEPTAEGLEMYLHRQLTGFFWKQLVCASFAELRSNSSEANYDNKDIVGSSGLILNILTKKAKEIPAHSWNCSAD